MSMLWTAVMILILKIGMTMAMMMAMTIMSMMRVLRGWLVSVGRQSRKRKLFWMTVCVEMTLAVRVTRVVAMMALMTTMMMAMAWVAAMMMMMAMTVKLLMKIMELMMVVSPITFCRRILAEAFTASRFQWAHRRCTTRVFDCRTVERSCWRPAVAA